MEHQVNAVRSIRELNNSRQTNGHLSSQLLRKKLCIKLAGEVLAMLSMSLRTIPNTKKKEIAAN